MSYSIKTFIRKNCTEEYDIDDIKDIANKVCVDSNGRYTDKSAMKILCRYAYVKHGSILFNTDIRNPDQTVEDIESSLKTSEKKQVTSPTKVIPSTKVAQPTKVTSLTKPQTSSNVTKGGFGSIASIRASIDEQTSINVKKGGFGSIASIRACIDEQKPESKSIKSIKTNDSDSSDDIFSTNKNTNFNKNLFSSAKNNNFKPSNSISSIKSKTSNTDSYKLPTEKTYKGEKRTDKTYGPYGTDSYHDEDLSDDEVNDKKVIKRTQIFEELSSRYYPPQRSAEWFKMREEMITASDGGTIVELNPYEQNFGFITKKVFGKPFDTNIDCYHGKKYEQVATMVYEYRMNVKVREFGLCRHPKHAELGASPDGIVSEFKLKTKDGRSWDSIDAVLDTIEKQSDKKRYMERFGYKTKFVGRMLEIKCPLRRKIIMGDAPEVYGPHGEKITDIKKDVKKGICPAYYWVQVQLQLQCCELDECDFWQCEIFEYADKDDFIEDTDPNSPWLSNQTGHEKGAVIQLMPFDQVNNRSMNYLSRIYNFAQFIYQPRIDMTPAEIDQWILDTLQNLKTTHKGMVFESIKYWKLVATRNITIKRDDEWFNNNIDTFKHSWKCVEYFRNNKDKAKILKRYINTFPIDSMGKIKEPPKEKGLIMNMINSIVNEPDEDASDSEHKTYAKLLANLEKHIIKANIPEPKEYDVSEDIKYISESLKIAKNLDEEQLKKFNDLVKSLKVNVENYLFDSDESEEL